MIIKIIPVIKYCFYRCYDEDKILVKSGEGCYHLYKSIDEILGYRSGYCLLRVSGKDDL